jgi:hypothetical protein
MSTAFWKGAGERAGKTFLQVGVATLGITAGAIYTSQAALALPWETALVTAGLSALASLATSLLNPSFTAGTSAVPIELGDGSVVPDTVPTGDGDVTSEDAGGQPVTEPKHAEGMAAS